MHANVDTSVVLRVHLLITQATVITEIFSSIYLSSYLSYRIPLLKTTVFTQALILTFWVASTASLLHPSAVLTCLPLSFPLCHFPESFDVQTQPR